MDILLDNEDGEAFHPDARGRCGDGPGFLSNRDIAYVFTGSSRGFGELLVLRGARADLRRHAPRAGHDAERRAAALLVLLPVRAGHASA